MARPNWRQDARDQPRDELRKAWEDTTHKQGVGVRYFIPYPDTGGQQFKVITRSVDGGIEIVLVEQAIVPNAPPGPRP